MDGKTMTCALCALLVCFTGCASLGSFGCPYLIADAHVEVGSRDGTHDLAGAYVAVRNETEKTMCAFTVSFQLYDADGNNPFGGSNGVVAAQEAEIPPNTETVCVISLDSFLADLPDEPYMIDFLYLREIRYTDGSRWSDPFGMYARGEHEG